MRSAFLAAGLVLIAISAVHAQAAIPDSLALARQYTEWFYTGEIDSLWAHHSAETQTEMGSERELLNNITQLTSVAGTEVQILDERWVKRLGKRQYWRTAKFSDFEEPILVRWVINPQGEIEGLGLGLASEPPEIDK